MRMFPGFVAWDSSEDKGMFIHRWVAVALLIDLRFENFPKEINVIASLRAAVLAVGQSVMGFLDLLLA